MYPLTQYSVGHDEFGCKSIESGSDILNVLSQSIAYREHLLYFVAPFSFFNKQHKFSRSSINQCSNKKLKIKRTNKSSQLQIHLCTWNGQISNLFNGQIEFIQLGHIAPIIIWCICHKELIKCTESARNACWQANEP